MAWFSRKEDPNEEIYKAYPWLRETIFPWVDGYDKKFLKEAGLLQRELKELAVDYASVGSDASDVEAILEEYINRVHSRRSQ